MDIPLGTHYRLAALNLAKQAYPVTTPVVSEFLDFAEAIYQFIIKEDGDGQDQVSPAG